MKSVLYFLLYISLIFCSTHQSYSQKAAVSAGPQIEVDDFDFGRHNIQSFNSLNTRIKVSNIGSKTLNIKKISINTNSVFLCPNLYNKQLPIVLQPGEIFSFDVLFNTNKIGLYKDTIVFSSDTENPADSICFLNCKCTDFDLDYYVFTDFGNCMINNKSKVISKKIVISNDTMINKFKDPVIFKQISSIDNKAFSESIDTIGTEGFYFDKKALIAKYGKGTKNLIELNLGDSLEFNVYFSPKTIGTHTVNLFMEFDSFSAVYLMYFSGTGIENTAVENIEIKNNSNLSVFPNPITNSNSEINFKIEKTANTTLRIVNTIGETIDILYDGELEVGNYNNFMIPDNLTNGIYYLELISGFEHLIQKFVVLK